MPNSGPAGSQAPGSGDERTRSPAARTHPVPRGGRRGADRPRDAPCPRGQRGGRPRPHPRRRLVLREPAPRRARRGAGNPGRRGASLRPAVSPGSPARAAVASRRCAGPRRAPRRRGGAGAHRSHGVSGSAATPTAAVRRASSPRRSRPSPHALLLLAYPLHPPGRPGELRVAHFPRLRTPALFVHGTTDPFGSVAELRNALAGIPAPTTLHLEPGVGHDLGASRRSRNALPELAARIADAMARARGMRARQGRQSSTVPARRARRASARPNLLYFTE